MATRRNKRRNHHHYWRAEQGKPSPVLPPEQYAAWKAAQEAARLAKYAEIDAARAAKAPRGNPAK